ncbi:chemotaxis protein CheB [Thalassococcus profundi]|uniref:protein-glutamate methylesterase n=1 Tax=Thalassococcus profundi TaxID=2282382 RepID=A0A369TLC0_9RHOB|nr:CheB methylesterase domain-containing protein [Thalassococcus profundi]RDD66058.1 chemotaxis protein CheB [Thalassococcus profundi]
MRQVSLVIAAQSFAVRTHFARMLEGFEDFHLVAGTRDLMETFAVVEDHRPQLVMIEQGLSQQPEFEVMRALFETLDIRWILLAAPRAPGAEGPDRRRSLIRSGLFEIDQNMPRDRIADTIRTITRMSTARAPRATTGAPVAAEMEPGSPMVLIGASTGGVDALLTVLSAFPEACPATLIVQHTGADFGRSLVRLLDRQCPAHVVPATDTERPRPGQIVVAAGLRAHLTLRPRPGGSAPRLALDPGAPICGHVPSVDALFRSAVPLGPRIAAALLTGMGSDGADGLLALRRAGAATIAQDAVTSVVYGMPRAAAEIGAAEQILPLPQIGPALLAACTARQGQLGAMRQ